MRVAAIIVTVTAFVIGEMHTDKYDTVIDPSRASKSIGNLLRQNARRVELPALASSFERDTHWSLLKLRSHIGNTGLTPIFSS